MGELVQKADGTSVYLKHWPGVYYDEKFEVWRFACAVEQCYLSVGCASEEIANEFKLKHTCPKPNGYTRLAWSVYGPSLLEKTWAELDEVTAKLMNGERSEENIGYARGLAFTLSLFMVPHFTTPAEISREAGKRFKMKAVDPEYCTPGLAARRYEAPPSDYKLDTRGEQPTRRTPAKGKQLSDTEIAAIKNAGAMFGAEELAKVYSIPVARVKEILAS